MEKSVELHPFTPFLPEGCRIILCGTFPPKQDKWAMDFFYPNFYNDMWRIFGNIFFDNPDHFFDRQNKKINKLGIQQMLTKYRIGIGETVTQAIRTQDNASDKFLEVVKTVDLHELFSHIPQCSDFVTTGEKAASVIASLTDTEVPKMGEYMNCEILMDDNSKKKFRHWRMPSTSRAYPMKLETKTMYYKNLLKDVGILKG